MALLKFQMGLPQSQDVQPDRLAEHGRGRCRGPAPAPGRGQLQHRRRRKRPRRRGAHRPHHARRTDNAAQRGQDQQTALSGARTGQLAAAFNYNNRIEFWTLETQQALAGLDLPTAAPAPTRACWLTAAYGFSGSGKTASDLFAFRGPDSRTGNGFSNQNWFGFGNVGLSLQIPVFDGFRRKYLVQQSRIQQQTIERGFETLRQSIDLQDAQSRTTLVNALDVLDNQKANLALADGSGPRIAHQVSGGRRLQPGGDYRPKPACARPRPTTTPPSTTCW